MDWVTSFGYPHYPHSPQTVAVYGQIMANRKTIGKPFSILDGQITSIAVNHGMTVATRHIRDFQDCGLALINPFE